MHERCAVVLVLCVVVAAACGGTGCSSRRQTQAMVEPAYSHLRQAWAFEEPLPDLMVSLASARRHDLQGP